MSFQTSITIDFNLSSQRINQYRHVCLVSDKWKHLITKPPTIDTSFKLTKYRNLKPKDFKNYKLNFLLFFADSALIYVYHRK